MRLTRHVARDIDRLDELTPARHQQVRDHIRSCDACERYYEAHRSLEDALFPGAVMAPSALERMQVLVLEETRPQRARRLPLLASLATAACAAVVLLVVVRQPDEELVARGDAAKVAEAALSVFAVDTVAKSATRLDRKDARVSAGTVVQMAYSNAHYSHLAVVGLDASGELQWFYPGGAGALQIGHATDEPLAGGWTLTSTTRLFAIFSEAALPPDAIVTRDLKTRDLKTLTALPGLEGFNVLQDSILVRVDER